MNTEQLIIDKVHQLPEFMHIQIIDYIDFLLAKYHENEDNKTIKEIPKEHKNLLLERYEKYKNNEKVGDTWENVKQRLTDKYAL